MRRSGLAVQLKGFASFPLCNSMKSRIAFSSCLIVNRRAKMTQYFLYLNHDIAFPSPTLTKAGDGAVHGVSTLWLDHAESKPAPPLFIVSNS